jgi:thymidylate synthase (FAD)
MKLIKSSFEILEQEPGIQGIYKQIERAGRTCYKSEDRITEDSAEKFVNMIKDRQHTAMLEHGTVYLYIYKDHAYNVIGDNWVTEQYLSNSYSVINKDSYGNYHITTNYRVLYENGWLDDLKHLCEPTEYHEKRITVKFILPISISREFCRHRVFSFAEQSTRYCNFSKDRFDNEITCILPYEFSAPDGHIEVNYDLIERLYGKDEVKSQKALPLSHIIESYINAESEYMYLIDNGCPPQIAREVLPLATKSELIMTGTLEQWKGFFKLRCDKAAHPQARELAIPLKEEFIKRNLLNEND